MGERAERIAGHGSHGIPRFYFGSAADQQPLQEKLSVVARERHLARKTADAVENSELELLWQTLEMCAKDQVGDHLQAASNSPASSSPDKTKEERFINYSQFRKCGELMKSSCSKFNGFFAPSVFLMLARNAQSQVSLNHFFDFVMRKVSLQQLRLALCSYDSQGRGYLSQSDLENYVYDMIPQTVHLRPLVDEFHVTYTVYATRKFCFFLDQRRVHMIRISDLIISDVFSEFLQLQDENASYSKLLKNWFAVSYVSRVHSIYIDLDRDKNGLLSKEEFSNYNKGSLVPQMVDRLYDEYLTFGGEMDYRTFLDFILAKEYPKTPQSIHYFFRLLDVEHKGYLTLFSINFFWRGLMEKSKSRLMFKELETISLTDLKNEIFDMVKPADPLRISCKELVECGNGHIVCSILTDITAFYAYENRESIGMDDPGPP